MTTPWWVVALLPLVVGILTASMFKSGGVEIEARKGGEKK